MEHNLLGWLELIVCVMAFTLVVEPIRTNAENKIRKAIRRKSL